VAASPHDLGEQLVGDNEAGVQAGAKGGGAYTGSSDPRPKIVGDYGEDVHSRSTEGYTVADDQSQENVTMPRGPQPDVL
jgi:hypothetical protein